MGQEAITGSLVSVTLDREDVGKYSEWHAVFCAAEWST